MSELRALVLSAGLGTRLRPLSQFLPKPLLPACGEPVLHRTLATLANHGCEAVAVNLHHLPERIYSTTGDRFAEMDIVYSTEEEIQGSLGALFPLRDFMTESEHCLVINGDSVCDWPIGRLLRQHRQQRAEVSLLLHRRIDPEAYGGGVGLDEGSRVVQLRDAPAVGTIKRRCVFAGLHLYSRDFLEREVFGQLGPGPSDLIADLYIPWLAAGGMIHSFKTAAPWHDLGTPSRYLAACLDLARGPRPLRRPASFLAPEAELDSSAEVRRSVVEGAARVRAEAKIEDSLILPGAEVSEGSSVRGSIIGPGVTLPPASRIEGRMICRNTAGYSLGEKDSLIGDLVYTRL